MQRNRELRSAYAVKLCKYQRDAHTLASMVRQARTFAKAQRCAQTCTEFDNLDFQTPCLNPTVPNNSTLGLRSPDIWASVSGRHNTGRRTKGCRFTGV